MRDTLPDRPRRLSTRPSGPPHAVERHASPARTRPRRVHRAARGDDQQDADRRLPRLRPAGVELRRASVLVDRLARRLGAGPARTAARATCCGPRTCRGRTPAARSTTAATTRAACAGRGRASATRTFRGAGRRLRARGALRRASACRRFVELTGYASSRVPRPSAARSYGAHESVTLRANRSGRRRPLHRRVHDRPGRRRRRSRRWLRRCSGSTCRRGPRPRRRHARARRSTPARFASRTMIAGGRARIEKAAGTEMRDKMLRIAGPSLERRRPRRGWRSAGVESAAATIPAVQVSLRDVSRRAPSSATAPAG